MVFKWFLYDNSMLFFFTFVPLAAHKITQFCRHVCFIHVYFNCMAFLRSLQMNLRPEWAKLVYINVLIKEKLLGWFPPPECYHGNITGSILFLYLKKTHYLTTILPHLYHTSMRYSFSLAGQNLMYHGCDVIAL